MQPCRLGAFCQTVMQFSCRHRGNAQRFHGDVHDPFGNLGVASYKMADYIGVQHVLGHSCHSLNGSRWPWPWSRSLLSKKSSCSILFLIVGRKPSHDSGLRDKMTSPVSGSLRMKTSLESNR